METTTPESPADQLVQLITSARTLTDEQKDAYLAEIFEGRIPENLDIDQLCDAEEAAANQDMQELEGGMAAMQELAQREDDAANAEAAASILPEHETELRDTVEQFNQDCSAEERNFDAGVEGDVRSEEGEEIADIQAMLGNKDDDPNAQT